jgi:hypothetical protein
MNKKLCTGFRLGGIHLAVAAALAVSSPAHALTWDWGNWAGSWDNTISYGISWRGESPDPALIGKGNGGTGEAILTDDGNLNFDRGDIFSNIIKGTSEIELDNGQFGAFGRIKYWYDFELENGKVPHGHDPNNYVPAEKLNDSDFADFAQFSGIALLDLFVYGTFDLGDNPLDIRLGRQVVNWGEATFIQGINVLNPIDVSAFRRPGAQIKEGLLPVGLLYGNLGLPAGWSLEAYYQFKWEETVIDPCGTYFSTADFAAEGCNGVIAPEVNLAPPGAPPFYLPDSVLQNINNIRKDPFVNEASDSGQFGLAARKYVEKIDTEFGFYYQRLHNRTPVLNVRYSFDAIAAGSILGGSPVPAYYQVAYPEDVDIYGLSFATNVGVVALSGEISYKKDMPVGVNGTTELIGGLGSLAGLQPIPELGTVAACVVPPPAALGQFGPRAWAGVCDLVTTGDGLAQGWDRFDVTQAQATALYFWDQGLGAQRVTLIGEVAWIGVDDLPSIAEMPYGRNPIFGAPTNLGGPNDKGFVTSSSWGYRVRAAANYPNVFAGVELTPSVAWSHDVNGTSPTPSFSDGRKAFSLALGANYLTKYRGSIAYTWFTGGVANPVTDRDFFSLTFSLDF